MLVIILVSISCAIAQDSDNSVQNKECPVLEVFPESPLTVVGDTINIDEDIWLKPGPSFKRIAFRVLKDKMFDFQGTIPDTTLLELSRELLNLLPSDDNKWMKIRFHISIRKKAFGKNTYVMRAFANNRTTLKDTGLWWREVEIKKIQVLVEGKASVTIDCIPNEAHWEVLTQEALKSEPFRYAFWVLWGTLLPLFIIASILITKYCKGKSSCKSLDLSQENARTIAKLGQNGDPKCTRSEHIYECDEHIYDDPRDFCRQTTLNRYTNCMSGEFENESIYDEINESISSVPRLTEECEYIQMDLYKK